MSHALSIPPHPAGAKAPPDDAAKDGPLDLAPFLAAPVRQSPYPYITAAHCLRPALLPALRRDFPHLARPGYHPVDTFTPTGAFAALLRQIEDGALDRAMTARFGIDLTVLPRLVTVRFTSAAHEGRAHTDSARKVATLLLYLHPGWCDPEGRIRVLRSKAIDDIVEEVPPEEGNIFAFLRSDTSWHGHTPFVGERRVLQVAWLRDAAAAERKRRQGNFTYWLKGLFGRH